MKSYTTKQRERKVIEFELDGDHYTFTSPKKSALSASTLSSIGTSRAVTDAERVRDLYNWFSEGLPEDQAMRLFDRLNDPEDDFDMDDLGNIVTDLVTEGTGRPTKRR